MDPMKRNFWMAALTLAVVPLMARAEVDKKVERTWKAKCASCHGADGKAQTDQGKKMKIADMTSAEWQKGKTDAQIKTAIEDGVKKGDAEMEGFKDKLPADQVEGLVAYVRSLK
jgi:mono/diheme cytochrome c family protein